jgi:hypothetical protein
MRERIEAIIEKNRMGWMDIKRKREASPDLVRLAIKDISGRTLWGLGKVANSLGVWTKQLFHEEGEGPILAVKPRTPSTRIHFVSRVREIAEGKGRDTSSLDPRLLDRIELCKLRKLGSVAAQLGVAVKDLFEEQEFPAQTQKPIQTAD